MQNLLLPVLAAADDSGIVGKLTDTANHITSEFHVTWYMFIGQAVNFCIVAFVIYHFAFKPVLATIDARNQKIAEGLKYTEDMKLKLAQTEQQQAEVLKQASLEGKKVIAEARDTGKALVDKAVQDAARTAEDIIKKGQDAIALERQQMLNDLRREVATLVVATANRVLARDLTADERARFNTAAAADLSKN